MRGRKRSLPCISVSVAANAPVVSISSAGFCWGTQMALSCSGGGRRAMWLLVVAIAVYSSPVRQHRVPPCRRQVSYTTFHVPDQGVPGVIPSSRYRNYQLRESSFLGHSYELWPPAPIHSNETRLKQPHNDEDAERGYHIVADASVQHPDNVFRIIREKGTTIPTTRSVPAATSDWFSFLRNYGRREARGETQIALPHSRQRNRRRLSRIRWLQSKRNDSEFDISTPFTDSNSGGTGLEGNSSTPEYNVTAETEYNVSAPIGGDYSANRTNDTSTVVYTKSERANFTNSSNVTASDGYGNDSDLSNDDEGEINPFQPIRIRAFLSEIAGGGEHLNSTERSILLQDIISPAMLAWSAALRVKPVVGNLTVDRSQLPDGASCGPGVNTGLPSVLVPSSHMTWGLPDTDMVIYISLAFVERDETKNSTNNDTSSSNQNTLKGGNSTAQLVSSFFHGGSIGRGVNSHSSADQTPSSSPTIFDTSFDGNSNLTSANNTNFTDSFVALQKQNCSGDFLAAASFCSTDQFDRPTAAILHLCLTEMFFEQSSLQGNIMLVMHELGHALGFNAISLAHFRRLDGSPITPRIKGEIPETEVECTGPRSGRRIANVTLPSPEILQFRSVRGGVRVAEVVTSSVAQVARNHFDCQKLPGAELESGEFLPLSTSPDETTCLGDHWERRLFKTHLMNPVVDDVEFNPYISTLTLAYFADSGWYQVDLSRASHAAGWGRGAGCAFVEEPCINSNGLVPDTFQNFFCNQTPLVATDGFVSSIQGCTQDIASKASCTLGLYDGDLPPEYQYFNFLYGSNAGGSDPFMDYCPVYSGFSNGLCSVSANEALIRVDQIEIFGRRNSRCLSANTGVGLTAICLPIACVVEDRTLRIQVDGSWEVCSYTGEPLLTRSGDSVICPDPIRICPTFYCSRDCLGTSLVCDYTVGECVCDDPSCEDDQDSGEDASDEMIFYDPPDSNQSLPEDSPLSDYYVTNARLLKEEKENFFKKPWGKASGSMMALVLLVGFLCWYRLHQKHVSQESTESGADDDGNAEAVICPERAKDKMVMIGTIVVDMRMNNPDLQRMHDVLAARVSETDVSMTDTDGAGTHASLDVHDASFHSIDQLHFEQFDEQLQQHDAEEVDSVASCSSQLEPSCIVRRRKRLKSAIASADIPLRAESVDNGSAIL